MKSANDVCTASECSATWVSWGPRADHIWSAGAGAGVKGFGGMGPHGTKDVQRGSCIDEILRTQFLLDCEACLVVPCLRVRARKELVRNTWPKDACAAQIQW
jgi:hypothetical protein